LDLNDDNFVLYAAKAYDLGNSGSMDEFKDDLNRFKYIRRLLKRYETTGDLKARLILNHVIILYNSFGAEATNMLFYRLEDYQAEIKPFVELLSFLPGSVSYNGKIILTDTIDSNKNVELEIKRQING
jgi:hypothetical protein